jgi:hypothetical protein
MAVLWVEEVYRVRERWGGRRAVVAKLPIARRETRERPSLPGACPPRVGSERG